MQTLGEFKEARAIRLKVAAAGTRWRRAGGELEKTGELCHLSLRARARAVAGTGFLRRS